ncbi:fructosamine kinase family protein [Williamsia deligens]|uniref:Fructosamine kinase family protein n=1 Tax=Williamsia deligens TaxID=321325 RepID=A0ABW3G2A6_9NOCA|nr:fructosamine kinase family protein [Williamsia deligens]MCP2194912.1 Fructosamine-3-kinase [Williamsia deligens]
MARPPEVHRKSRPGAPAGFFAAEAAGLRWLADAGAPVVEVIDVGEDHIELVRLASARPDTSSARRFGAALARMHAAGADAFGAPPDGYTGPTFIGSREQTCVPTTSWGRFYVRQRVQPFVDVAVRAGTLTSADEEVVREVCGAVAEGALDDGETPARLHGDLWNGNVLWTPDGVVMIDPAAHGGHRETDLAMLALFGCPLLDDVILGYEEQSPLREGWRNRIALHQLHPLAVHAAGHGPSYGRALGEAARSVRDDLLRG